MGLQVEAERREVCLFAASAPSVFIISTLKTKCMLDLPEQKFVIAQFKSQPINR